MICEDHVRQILAAAKERDDGADLMRVVMTTVYLERRYGQPFGVMIESPRAPYVESLFPVPLAAIGANLSHDVHRVAMLTPPEEGKLRVVVNASGQVGCLDVPYQELEPPDWQDYPLNALEPGRAAS